MLIVRHTACVLSTCVTVEEGISAATERFVGEHRRVLFRFIKIMMHLTVIIYRNSCIVYDFADVIPVRGHKVSTGYPNTLCSFKIGYTWSDQW